MWVGNQGGLAGGEIGGEHLGGRTLEPEQQGFRQARPVGTNAAKARVQMEIFQHLSERPDGDGSDWSNCSKVDGPNPSDCRQHEGCTHGVLRETNGHTKGLRSIDNRVPSKDQADAHRGVSREVLGP